MRCFPRRRYVWLSATALSALILCSAAQFPVPPPVAQVVADCEHITYASDQLVCADDALLALDHALTDALPLPAASTLALEESDAWFRRSRMCAMRSDHYACLRAAYRERISVARAAQAYVQDSPEWRNAACGKSVVRLADLGSDAVAVKQDAQVWLAVSATELASWKPFSWMQRKGMNLEIHGPDDIVLHCKLNDE